MGILDFSSVFDILDERKRGYVDADQVRQYDEVLHFTPICTLQVDAAVRQVCGKQAQGKVSKDMFLPVLQDLERRRQLEESVRWDFMALDKMGNHQIALDDALMLMKMTHGVEFSMDVWNSFLKSRGENKHRDVYFDEMRLVLCDIPDGSASREQDMEEERKRLHDVQEQEMFVEFEYYKKSQEDDARVKDKLEYEERTKRIAKRKFNRWEKEGIEAVIYDDGLDDGSTGRVVPKNVGIREVNEALENKYDDIRKKLFWDILRKHYGDTVWITMSDSEQVEAFQHIFNQEKQFRKTDTLTSKVHLLEGSEVNLESSLINLLGDLHAEFVMQTGTLDERRVALMSKGRTEADIDKMFREEFEKAAKEPAPCTNTIVQLNMRYRTEKDIILQRLRSNTSKKKQSEHVTMIEYCRLLRQLGVIEEEEGYVSAALAVGLAEREQDVNHETFDADRARQERLSHQRLESHKNGNLKLPTDDESRHKNRHKTKIELQTDIVLEIMMKHALERQFMMELLQGKESNSAKSTAKQMNDDELSGKMTSLRNQRNAWRDAVMGYKVMQRHPHTRILQEATAIYYEELRKKSNVKGQRVNDGTLCAQILADLQEKQDIEYETIIVHMQGKHEEYVIDIKKSEETARKEELYDNIAAVVLGTTKWTEEEKEYIGVLEEKYDSLRALLFSHLLKLEMGIGWERSSDKEKYNLLSKKMTDESKLREEGKLEEMGLLIHKFPKDIGSLRTLMGEDRAEYQSRVKAIEEMKKHNAMLGKQVDMIANIDETPPGQIKSHNLLADMIQRCFAEQDAVIGYLRSCDPSKPQHKLAPMALVKVEQRRAEREEWFDIGALGIGLMERVVTVSEKRHKTDQTRQYRLAELRYQSRVKREQLSKTYRHELDDYAPPAKGDIVGWMESYLKEMEKKHREEREAMMSLLQDASMEDLRETAQTMSQEECEKRVVELYSKFKRLDLNMEDDRDEYISILEEAAAIRSVLKQRYIVRGQKKTTISHEQVAIALLTDLQDTQDAELSNAVKGLKSMEEEDLRIMREYEIKARHERAVHNVLLVLTKYEGVAEDGEIVKALDEKYNALRDKLLAEALMKQMGEGEWQRLSEMERQKKLLQLKMEEKRLRREEKYDELSRLLGEGQLADENLRKLMGLNRAEYERRLRQRLEKKRQKGEEGEGYDGEIDEEGGIVKSNPLDELQYRYEKEKEALMARLRGANEDYFSEKERQAELVRLKREERRIAREDGFEKAAIMIGLCERQNALANESKVRRQPKPKTLIINTGLLLIKDRERQEQLAKERLEELRRRKAEKKKNKEVNDIVKDGGRIAIQDAILARLDEKHENERELFVEILSTQYKDDQKSMVHSMSEMERTDKLHQLKHNRSNIAKEKVNDQIAILVEAHLYKREAKQQQMTSQGEHVTDDDLVVSFMADLQERQDRETEEYIQMLPLQEDGVLVSIQKRIIDERKLQVSTNIAEVLLGYGEAMKATEQDVILALGQKYSALRDKLFIEALAAKFGNKWQQMSENDKQKEVREMRTKEQEIISGKKWSETVNLLGGVAGGHASLQILLLQTQAELEEIADERKKKREQRLREGFTEEDCDKLEKDEAQTSIFTSNVLQDIYTCDDKEKLKVQDKILLMSNKSEKEKCQQFEVVRLRREQRLVRQEQSYDVAALALSLSRLDVSLHLTRKHQYRLAKMRLESHAAHQSPPCDRIDVPSPQDDNDLVGYQEAVSKEVEKKHAEEREFLVQLFNDPVLAQKRSEVQQQSRDDKQNSLEELRLRVLQLKQNDVEETREEVMDCFLTGLALQMELMCEHFASEGQGSSEEFLQASLLADLQMEQDREARKIFSVLQNKSIETLKQLKQGEAISRRQQWNDNVASTVFDIDLLGLDTTLSPEEKELVEALENKYDEMRIKLMMEALKDQIGEEEWRRMSEKDRQNKITKAKLRERRLRKLGKFNEIDELIGQNKENQKELSRKLGATKAQQEEQMKERLRRRKEMMKERQAKGLSSDTALVEAILDEEDQKRDEDLENHKSVMEQLQLRYEDEKEALLANVRNQEGKIAAERQRQLALAKLKMEQKRLKHEDNVESAALLISASEQHEKARETQLLKERERQQNLARERIEKRRKKQDQGRCHENNADEIAKQLKSDIEKTKVKDALDIANAAKQGLSALQESVLEVIESKHESEREVLLDLIHSVQSEEEYQGLAQSVQPNEARLRLEMLRQERDKWRRKSMQQVAILQEQDNLSTEQIDRHVANVASSRADQYESLATALTLKLKVEKGKLLADKPKMSDDELVEACSVFMMTNLQNKQHAECNAVNKLMSQQDERMLIKLKETQRTSKDEGWLDNLVNAIFSFGHVDDHEDTDDETEAPNPNKVTQDLSKQYEEEKTELKKKFEAEGKQDAVEAELQRLESQQAAHRAAVLSNINKQKDMLKARLEARKQAADNKEYEQETAAALMKMAERQHSFIVDKNELDRGRQNEQMQARLEARREERRRQREDAIMHREGSTISTSSSSSRPSTPSRSATGNRHQSMPILGLKREKTVVDVDLSDEQKNEIYKQLVREQAAINRRLSIEHSKHEEQLKKRLKEMKGRRSMEAAHLMHMAERQKTTLEKARKEEREHQLSVTKERVARLRYEKTQTMKEKGEKSARKFDEMLSKEEAAGKSEDEKMKLVAKKMEVKFKDQEK